MLTNTTQYIYTPKSKIHLHLGWQSLFIEALGCSDKFNVLIRIIQSTDNTNSIYADANGVEHPGMLINYNYLAQALCLSRRTIQRILNQLEADGYIHRIKLGRGKVLAQTTQKTCDLRDEIHTSSAAYKENEVDYQQFSKNFEIVYTQQKEIANLPAEVHSKNNLGQIDREAKSEPINLGQFVTPYPKTDLDLGQIGTTPLNEIKVNRKKTINNNQYQVLETVTEFENADCLTVVFYFDEFGLGEIHAEEDLFDYFTVAQSKILNTITYCYAESLDINLFNETLARKDLRKEAQSFRQLVDWAYAAAMGDQEKNIVSNQDLQSMLNEAIIISNDQNSAEKRMVDFNVCDTNHQRVIDRASITQTQNDSVMENNNTVDLHHGKIIYGNQAFGTTVNLNSMAMPVNKDTEPKPIRSAINSNTVDLMEAFSVCDAADTKHFKTCQNSVTKHHGGSTMKRNATSTTNHNNYKIKVANQDYHRDSVTAPTANNLEIPVVEKEVLCKDWASLADQNFYKGVLPDSQKIALVAIIDYVKRKGVVIGSDTEIYRWLYHTVSHHERYYSRAVNFKHLANIFNEAVNEQTI